MLPQLPWQLGQTIPPSSHSTTEGGVCALLFTGGKKGALHSSPGIRCQTPTYVSPPLSLSQLWDVGELDVDVEESMSPRKIPTPGGQQVSRGQRAPGSHEAGRQQGSKVTTCFKEHVLFREQVDEAYMCN